ncbi:MAG: class II aldolase/adducin family protein [Smithellaceae bacterium]
MLIKIMMLNKEGRIKTAGNVGRVVAGCANACIIQNYGIVAPGRTLDEAILHAELLEKVTHIYYPVLSTGKPVTILQESSIRAIVRMRKAQFIKK